MAGYKVSYKILRQQGEDIKATAKLVDGYAERVGQIRGKLGNDGLLAEVRSNLQKLQGQLGESRTVLNVAGEFLVKSVESYSGAETRQVKKVDGTKAHNRDFYKNPVVVASVGGAVGGGAAAAAVSTASASVSQTTAAPSTTVNYADNSVTNVTYSAPEPAVSAAQPVAQSVSAPVSAAPASASPAPTPSAAPTAAAPASGSNAAGVVAGSVLGGAAAAGAVAGGLHLKKKLDASKTETAQASTDSYNPEAELEKALARVRELDAEDNS